MKSKLVIERADPSFSEWRQVLELLHAAFEYQRDRIDPPSSLYRLDETSLAEKAARECLVLARSDDQIVGCVFVRRSQVPTYLGKLAVRPDLQRMGIGRRLMEAVEAMATEDGSSVLELETRIELTENHETFGQLGFVKVSENSHEGYDRPTFITMQKRLCA